MDLPQLEETEIPTHSQQNKENGSAGSEWSTVSFAGTLVKNETKLIFLLAYFLK